MNSKESLTIDMHPKDVIKLDIAELDKYETYPGENVLPEDGLYRLYTSQANDMEINYLLMSHWIYLGQKYVSVRSNCKIACNPILYCLEGGPDRAFVRDELLLIPENTQEPTKCEIKWK